MKFLFTLALFTGALFASPLACPPVLSPDGQPVNPSCPGLGEKIYAVPGSIWTIDWNDNFKIGDFDFNDLDAQLAFNATGTAAVVTFLGSAAALDDALYYGPTRLFSDSMHLDPVTISTTPGHEVVLGLSVPGSAGGFYYDGPGSRNSDQDIHAWVAEIAPEPSTLALMALGFIGLGVFANRKG